MTFLIALSACTSSEPNTVRSTGNVSTIRSDAQPNNVIPKDSPTIADDNQLLGAWTDGSSENASFAIDKDSIFYVDALTSYRYTLKEDSLIIAFPGRNFSSNVKFRGDTLMINDPESGTSRYTRFKD